MSIGVFTRLRFSISSTEETLTIMGKVDGLPYTHTAQFIVTASDAIGLKVTRNDLDLHAYLHPGENETLGELTVTSHALVSLGNFLLVSAVYECKCIFGSVGYQGVPKLASLLNGARV